MLFQKMLKDLQANLIQFLAIFTMAFISVSVLSGLSASSPDALDRYLTDTNYRDLDVQGQLFTREDIDALQNLPQIRSVNGYYNTSGKIELGGEKNILLTYLSGNDISEMLLKEGVPYTEGASGIWLDATFCEAMGIGCGDIVTIMSDQIRLNEEVKGMVYSPQYLYYMPDSYVEATYGEYSFGFMDISECPYEDVVFDELLIDIEGVSGQLNLTASEDRLTSQVSAAIKKTLDSEELVMTTKGQDYQIRTYLNSLNSLLALKKIFPILFGCIALIGILSTMTRLIARQRTVIGALKALGFRDRTITFHYMSYGIFTVFLGCVVGAVVGYYVLGDVGYENMTWFFLNPYECKVFPVSNVYFALLLTASAAVVAYYSNKRVLSQNAAVILQPESPKAFGTGWYEKLPIWSRLRFSTRWNVQDVARNKLRTVMSLAGIMTCSALIFAAFGFWESLAKETTWMYGELVRANDIVNFSEQADYDVVYDYAKEYRGQMIENEPIMLFTDASNHRTSMTVVDKGNCYFINDMKGQYVDLDGVALSYCEAKILGVKEGDFVSWKVSGTSKAYTERVAFINRNPITQGITLSRDTWEKLQATFEPNCIYTNRTVPKNLEEKAEIESVNAVASLSEGMRRSNEANYSLIVIVISLSLLMGVVILYNMGSLSYMEKSRDMSTLKVLGFRARDLKAILMQQNLILSAVGTVMGIPFGYRVLELLISTMGEDLDCMIQVSLISYICTFMITFLLSVIMNARINAKIETIDMVTALKGV